MTHWHFTNVSIVKHFFVAEFLFAECFPLQSSQYIMTLVAPRCLLLTKRITKVNTNMQNVAYWVTNILGSELFTDLQDKMCDQKIYLQKKKRFWREAPTFFGSSPSYAIVQCQHKCWNWTRDQLCSYLRMSVRQLEFWDDEDRSHWSVNIFCMFSLRFKF